MKKYIKPTLLVVRTNADPVLVSISEFTKDWDGYAIIYENGNDDDWDGTFD